VTARGLIARNIWSLLTVAAVLGALIATIAVVSATAGNKDHLRQAQVALAQAPGALAVEPLRESWRP
jgi:hypothetical protein